MRARLPEAVWRDYFKFAWVRDPYARFVSACAMLNKRNPGYAGDETGFMKRALRVRRFRERALVRPQWDMLADEQGALGMDFVGRYETLQRSFDEACRHIGIAALPLSRSNATEHGDHGDYYDAELLGVVTEFYRRDFDAFGYDRATSPETLRLRLSKPFSRLPFRFDAGRLADEAGQFGTETWMAHPSGLRGNSAIALISSGGTDNDSFEGEKQPTPHLDACPYTRQVMASFGEVLSRSRLMKLDAGAEVRLHVDFNYHWFSRVRIHIPVVTEPEVTFHCGPERLHMADGECWIFDSWRRHRVVNAGARDRIHLVIDTCGSSRFWNLVRDVEDADPAATAARAQLVPFEPGAPATLKTERFASLPVMAPGECMAPDRGPHCGLLRPSGQSAPTGRRLRRVDARLRPGLAGGVAAVWAPSPRGHAPLPSLDREGTRPDCIPDMRALTVRSNRIGVNAIFVQRVLNAALAPDARMD